LPGIKRFLAGRQASYTAADVVGKLMEGLPAHR